MRVTPREKSFKSEIEDILGPRCFTAPRIEVLQQCAVAVLDATQERDRLKLLLEAVRGELRTLAAISMKQRGTTRLVLTRKEFAEIGDVEVVVESPEPGVRIYELRKREEVEPQKPKSRIIQSSVARALN